MKTIAVVNQKGGVGKSTLSSHLGYAAEKEGLRCLLVDFDRQASLGQTFTTDDDPHLGAAAEAAKSSLALFGERTSDISVEKLSENLSIIRAHEDLAGLGEVPAELIRRPAQHLQKLAADYDVCVIDTPGVLGFVPPMTIAALVAADGVVCPTSVGLYEAKAIRDVWQYLLRVRETGLNPRLSLIGMLPSKVHTVSRDEMEGLAKLREELGDMVLPVMLGERASVKQATARRRPVWLGTRGAGHKKAADEWKAATAYILKAVGALK